MTAAFALAQDMDEDQMIIVQESEYTGAGKHVMPQLTFAKQNGIDVRFGNPDEEVSGKSLVFPENPSEIKARNYDLEHAKKSYIKNCVKNYHMKKATEEDIKYIMEEIRKDRDFVEAELKEHGIDIE